MAGEDTLSFLDGPAADKTPATETPIASTPTVETPKEEVKTEEVAAQPAAPTGETQPKAEVPKEEPKVVPLATFLDVLNENKELKKGNKAPEKAEEVQFEIPDPVKNPAEYAAYQETMQTFNIMNERMNVSERFARKEHGDELVDKVREYVLARMDEDPAFANKVVSDADPYGVAVTAYKEKLELDEYREWVKNGKQPKTTEVKTAEEAPKKTEPVKVVVQPAAVANQQPAVAAPKSIADQPSGGGGAHVTPTGPGQAFDSVFPGDQ